VSEAFGTRKRKSGFRIKAFKRMSEAFGTRKIKE